MPSSIFHNILANGLSPSTWSNKLFYRCYLRVAQQIFKTSFPKETGKKPFGDPADTSQPRSRANPYAIGISTELKKKGKKHLEEGEELPPASATPEDEEGIPQTESLYDQGFKTRQPSPIPFDNMSERPTELKVGTPTHFDGNTNDSSRWLHSVMAYLVLNDRIYNTSDKKITSQGALIEWYARGLNFAISKKIIRMEITPTTLDKTNESQTTNYSSNSSRNQDPNAMDVDAIWLSPSQRADYMKKGLCFVCGKHGHRSSKHKKGKVPFDKDSRTSSPKVRKAEIPSSDPISTYTAGLKKKKISQKEILDVLKMCFDSDNEEEGTEEEQVPVSKVSFDSSF
ncbi:hypothetical protein PAXINDRAFT_20303 [Paxillus involutus ATCC 200175]|uniref:CCHC-type domain-containing protein n=1 Tax=Paxillus involutus ATCC 200175 TaxID=664439 RepID=A0A0C9SMP0_PAXIN|nr:hypothetical protein PAXINDRAFT_20303 [Paxillus involutus ATCC 200175]